mgnify:CR=1 FL=1
MSKNKGLFDYRVSIPGEKRRRTLNATKQLLFKTSPASLRIEDVALAANVSSTAIYEDFGSKDRLILKVLLEEFGNNEETAKMLAAIAVAALRELNTRDTMGDLEADARDTLSDVIETYCERIAELAKPLGRL